MKLIPLDRLVTKNIKKEQYNKYLRFVPNFKEEKTQKFVTIALTLFASIVLGIFAVSPTLSTIAKLRKQLDDARFVEEKLSQKINNLSILQQKYNALQNDLPLVFDAVPQKSEVPLLAAQIQGIAQETGLTIKSFQTFQVQVSDSQISNKKFSSFEFNVSASGDYQNLLNFLDRMVNFQRVLTIQNVSISKTASITNQTLQISMKGTVYFKK